jgi:hypothetical protein
MKMSDEKIKAQQKVTLLVLNTHDQRQEHAFLPHLEDVARLDIGAQLQVTLIRQHVL